VLFSCTESEDGSTSTLPRKGVSFTDPDYGTTVVRITDKTIDNFTGPGIENEYARTDPENCNGTYIVLRSNNGEWYLYDAATYQMIRHLSIIESGGEELEARWDKTQPDLFYFFDGPQLKSYNVTSNTSSVVHDFSNDLPAKCSYITTKTEGDASLDRRYWCLMLENQNYQVIGVVVYDRTSNAILGQKTSFKDDINWVSMDMSGAHCVIGYEDSDSDTDLYTPPVDVFNRDFSFVVSLPEGSTGHMDLAQTAGGADVMVYQNNATDWIAMADLATGVETNLVQIPFNVNVDIGLHISGNCSTRPGWVLVSTYNSYNPPAGNAHSWMDNLLFLVELKASPALQKLAKTNAYTSKEFNGEKNYFAEAFAAINSAGTRVYFGSNWGLYETDYTDAYVVTVPQAVWKK
jgi:hypothetical protein